MDFIVKLPSSSDQITEEVYDSILVIVDRLTKYTHFIPYKETYTAEQLARIVIDRLIRYYGIPCHGCQAGRQVGRYGCLQNQVQVLQLGS